jgi:hypothetical protein
VTLQCDCDASDPYDCSQYESRDPCECFCHVVRRLEDRVNALTDRIEQIEKETEITE